MTTLEDRKYTKTHEWVKIEDDQVIIGISDHAQESLGDITFIELPVVGETVDRGSECGVIESVKAAWPADHHRDSDRSLPACREAFQNHSEDLGGLGSLPGSGPVDHDTQPSDPP